MESLGWGKSAVGGNNAEVLLMGLENNTKTTEDEYKDLVRQQITNVLTKMFPSPAPNARHTLGTA